MRQGQHFELVFNVAGLLKEPVGATREYELHDPRLELDGDVAASELEGRARLLRIGSGILATGDVSGEVNLECARCLVPIHRRVEAHIEEEYRPTVDLRTGAPMDGALEGEEEEDFFRISSDHLLNLTEAIRQNLLVSLPMNPLCKPDCAGLCPVCGADLNVENCGHTLVRQDPRLSALASLLDSMEEEGER